MKVRMQMSTITVQDGTIYYKDWAKDRSLRFGTDGRCVPMLGKAKCL